MQLVIEWSTGSRDKIYVDYDYGSFDDTLSITSDANTGAARSKTIHVTAGNITRNIVVSQDAGSPQPEFHTKIKFDGTAFIETDIVPPTNFSISVNCGRETLKSTQRMFGVAGEGYPNSIVFGFNQGSKTSSTLRYFSVYYGKTSALNTAKTVNRTQYPEYSLYLTPKRFGWGNAAYTITKGSINPSGGIVFGSNPAPLSTASCYTGIMAIIRIFDSSAQNATSYSNLNTYTPVYTLRPCVYNGEVGLWCVETSKFYGNSASSGTLEVRD